MYARAREVRRCDFRIMYARAHARPANRGDQPVMSLEIPDLPPLWSSRAPIGHKGGPALLPRAPGRTSISTPDLRDRICDLLCDGVPLTAICRTPGMPGRSTVQRWRRDDPGSLHRTG